MYRDGQTRWRDKIKRDGAKGGEAKFDELDVDSTKRWQTAVKRTPVRRGEGI